MASRIGRDVTAMASLSTLLLWTAVVPAVAAENRDPLGAWRAAWEGFQQAGRLIGEGEFGRAQTILKGVAAGAPDPYGKVASCHLGEFNLIERMGAPSDLDDLFGPPGGVPVTVAVRQDSGAAAAAERASQDAFERRNASYRARRLGHLCFRLGAYQAAIEWLRQAAALCPEEAWPLQQTIARCLVEAGSVQEVQSAYEQCLEQQQEAASGLPQSHQRNLREQLAKERDLVCRWRANGDDVDLGLEFVREYYIRHRSTADIGAENCFPALATLERLLPRAQSEAQLRQTYGLILQCLDGLGDEAGRRAWEEKLLREFSEERAAYAEVHAGVLTQRAQAAYTRGDLDGALRQWRLVCDRFPDSQSYGVAQYNVGYTLQKQRKFAEAIGEYRKLLRSKVDDRDAGADIMEAYRNYRHRAAEAISESYEATGDLQSALKWAILAARRYRYLSWCGTCQMQESARTTQRTIRLMAKISEAERTPADDDLSGLADALVADVEAHIHLAILQDGSDADDAQTIDEFCRTRDLDWGHADADCVPPTVP